MATKIIYMWTGKAPMTDAEMGKEMQTLNECLNEGFTEVYRNEASLVLYKPDGVASEDKGMLFGTVAEFQREKTARSSTAGVRSTVVVNADTPQSFLDLMKNANPHITFDEAPSEPVMKLGVYHPADE